MRTGGSRSEIRIGPIGISRSLIVIATVVPLVSLIAYFTLGRELIEAAYSQRIPALAGLMPGAGILPLSHYTAIADPMMYRVCVAQLALISTLGIATRRISVRGIGSRLDLMLALAVVASLGMLTVSLFAAPAVYDGDPSEYFQMSQSLANHLTPDLREQDIADWDTIRVANGIVGIPPKTGYFQSPENDRWYSYHFWLYPAVGTPAKLILGALGLNEAKQFELTNLLMFCAAIASIIWGARIDLRRRLMLASLLSVSPLFWYSAWPNPEVFTASLVMVSLVAANRGQYAAAIALAACGSMQNPPVAFLAFAYVVAYAARNRHRLVGWQSVRVCVAAALVLVPSAFYYTLFGVPNLIMAQGDSSISNITVARVLDVLFDPNMGLIAYVPGMLLAAMLAVALGMRNRDAKAYALAFVLLAMILMSASTSNWNSGAAGLMRYATWMLPLLAWMATASKSLEWRSSAWAAAVVLPQVIVLAATPMPLGANAFSPAARAILDHAPSLYSPPAEVFVDRTLGVDGDKPDSMPVFYSTERGVTKILASDTQDLGLYCDIEGTLSPAHAADTDGLEYINCPPGQVKPKTQCDVIDPSDTQVVITCDAPAYVGRLEVCPIHSQVTNLSEQPWYPGGARAVVLRLTLGDGTGGAIGEPVEVPLRRAMFTGDRLAFDARIVSPNTAGEYEVTVQLVQLPDTVLAPEQTQQLKLVVR